MIYNSLYHFSKGQEMPFYNRKHMRLKDYDYGLAGVYFITICTKDRKNLFWRDLTPLNIYSHPDIKLNKYGGIVKEVWLNSEKVYDDVMLDAYAIMPNHFHGIIVKEKGGKRTIGNIIGQFKSIVVKKIHEYDPHLEVWQRDYNEHVLREKEAGKIQYYVINNPYKFSDDKYYI